MAEFWQDWKKPWSRDQCERRYIQGATIGLRDLARLAGRALGSVGKWASEGDWKNKRERFQEQLGTATQEKAIEKASERLSDEIADIAIANYQAHKMVRDYVVELITIRTKALEEDKKRTDLEPNALLKKHGAESLNYLSLALSRSTQEIAAVTGLQYHVDINAAIRRIEREGLGIERVANSSESEEQGEIPEESQDTGGD